MRPSAEGAADGVVEAVDQRRNRLERKAAHAGASELGALGVGDGILDDRCAAAAHG